MPRLERFNEKTQRPNVCVNFIKPLPGPDYDVAHDFLSRIVAIAAPITRAHHLSIMTVEEFEPNREFWGRNFNAGECIQLVLKSLSTGQWLPFRTVQMVFMHELAHCVEMNHSRAFWAVRNTYCDELKTLWAKEYTGDGLWGRGRSLYDGQLAGMDVPAADQEIVASLCGGSYRGVRRRRKRTKKAKPKETYAEAKQRRIKKKFGEGGKALGDDEETRRMLEGRSIEGKPRVAQSARGRELRAAAALARFGQASPDSASKEDSESETESEYEEADLGQQARGINGEYLLDTAGHRLIRTCEGEDVEEDANAQREMEELGTLSKQQTLEKRIQKTTHRPEDSAKQRNGRDCNDNNPKSSTTQVTQPNLKPFKDPPPAASEASISDEHAPDNTVLPSSSTMSCPICSLDNTPTALTCEACAHVLHPERLARHWPCKSKACKDLGYINAEDVGVCGLCGGSKC